MKIYVIAIFLICFYSNLFSQFNKTIRSGRPGQSIGPFTTGKSILQFQQGIDYNSLVDVDGNPTSYLNDNVIRFGILEDVEVSALVDYRYTNQRINNVDYSQEGLSDLHLGFRVNLTQQQGIIPNSGFQMRLKMPNISEEFGSKYLAPVMIYIANWSLPKNFGINTNFIYTTNGNDAVPVGKYILNFGFPIYKKLSGFVENYGQIRGDVFETRFDGGIAFLATNDVQFDLFGGYGSNNNIADYFLSLGISWRLNFRKSINN